MKMELDKGYDTGIESNKSDESDDERYIDTNEVQNNERMANTDDTTKQLDEKVQKDLSLLFKAIYDRDGEGFVNLINKTKISSHSLERELPKMICEITHDIIELKSQDITNEQHRRYVLNMEAMLVRILRMLTRDILERFLHIVYYFSLRREIFLVACEYNIHSVIDHMLKNIDICNDMQETLYEGIKRNVYSHRFSESLIDMIINADTENILNWNDVLDVIMELHKDHAKQRVCRMLKSKMDLGNNTLGRIFHYSCRYDWREFFEYDIWKNLNLRWPDLKSEIVFCFTRKGREEIGCRVLQLVNEIKPFIGNPRYDWRSESTESIITGYMSYALDIGLIHKNAFHQPVLEVHQEIFFDKRIQYMYTDTCLFNKNKLLSYDFANSFDKTSLAFCEKCKERYCQSKSSILQFIQTQHILMTKKFEFHPEIFESALRGNSILLVALLWKYKLKHMKWNEQFPYRPLELPHYLRRDFSLISGEMQKLLRDMYCHDFTMIHRIDIYYIDLSLKTVIDSNQDMKRKEVFLVAVYECGNFATGKQQRFGGIPIIWRSLAEIIHSSKVRSEMSLQKDIGIPHYIKEQLFKQHRNLTILSTSSRREIGNEVLDMKYPNYCVVLYCWAKGYVPVGEKEFPRNVGHFLIVTDIREGFCSFAAGNKIFPGAGIYKRVNEKKVGTLGGFVEKNGEIYGLTCAHVLLDEDELTKSTTDINLPVYTDDTDFKIGTLYCHAFESDRCQDVSVDAALIKLHSTIEIDHFFPKINTESLSKAGFCDNKLPVYDEGTTISVDEEHRNWVIKYGITTGLTCGLMDVNKGTCARINRKIKLPSTNVFQFSEEEMETDNEGNEGYMMYNQTEVYGNRRERFFELGDSGSLVFKIMEESKLRCLGLAIALTSYGSALVTPIDNVLSSLDAKCPSASNQDDELHMKRFKRDVQNAPLENNENNLMAALLSQMQQLQSNIGDNMTRIETKIDTKFSAVEQKMEEKFVTVENELQNIKTYIFPQVSTSPDTHREEGSDDDL